MHQIKSLIIIGLFTSSLAASVAKALTVPLSLTPGPTVADVTLVFSVHQIDGDIPIVISRAKEPSIILNEHQGAGALARGNDRPDLLIG